MLNQALERGDLNVVLGDLSVGRVCLAVLIVSKRNGIDLCLLESLQGFQILRETLSTFISKLFLIV